MTTPNSSENSNSQSAGYLRQESSDGTVFWGDVSPMRFERAAERFPVLKYVIDEYFGSPEQENKDVQFLARYAEIGEDSAEFNGFLDDLTEAIKQYSMAASLINGLMGTTMTNGEVRNQLTMLKDQVLEQGEFDPQATDDQDPFLINSASDRIQASFMWRREIPIGPLKGKAYPVVYYFLAGVAIFLLGLGISYIPYVGGLGVILMLIGGIVCFVVAVGTLAMRNDYLHPEKERAREAKKAEMEDKKDDKNQSKPGLVSRMNPFKN